MEASPLAAVDLPLKVAVWAGDGLTNVSYPAPKALAARYGLAPADREACGNRHLDRRARHSSRARGPHRPAERPARPRRPRRGRRASASGAGGSSSPLLLLAFNIYFGSRATQAAVARPRPVQPVLPPAGASGQRQGDHLEGHGDPGHVHGEGALRRTRSRRRASRRRFPRSPTTTRSRSCSRSKGVVVNAQPLDNGRALVAEPAARLRADDPVRRPALLADAPRRATCRTSLGSFGRSRARRYQPSGDRVTFADVAGIDEAKDELTEVVDFLRHPEKYRKLGGRIPHGVLLSGPPGTGKTLLARAVAGEADAPVLLDGRLRVRRGDRRRRRLARARPLHAGEGGRAGDHLHRRARRDRPLAHVRASPASAAATTSASRR